jgi:hypothetical protein
VRWQEEAGGIARKPQKELLLKKATEVSYGPAKNFMMTGENSSERLSFRHIGLLVVLLKTSSIAGIMLWMSGSYLNIFTIMFTAMAIMNPIKSIMATNKSKDYGARPPWMELAYGALCAAFNPFSDGGNVDLMQQKLVFVALNLVALGVGIWKCKSLGLLPTTVSDWATFETVGKNAEFASGSYVSRPGV